MKVTAIVEDFYFMKDFERYIDGFQLMIMEVRYLYGIYGWGDFSMWISRISAIWIEF